MRSHHVTIDELADLEQLTRDELVACLRAWSVPVIGGRVDRVLFAQARAAAA